MHRIIFPPFVRLLGASTQPSDSMLPYIPWAHGLDADEPEDVSDVDEGAEDAAEAHELLQEAELDKRDRAAAKEYEDKLFKELGVHQGKRTFTDAFGTWDVSRVEKTARRLLASDVPRAGRKRRAKANDGSGAGRKRRRVKTEEFVHDSDDEGEDLGEEDDGMDGDKNARSGEEEEEEEREEDENAGASEGEEIEEEDEESEHGDE